MKKLLSILTIIILSINLVGCEEIGVESFSSEEEINYPVQVGELEFDNAPATIASLSPAITEIICDLGYQSLIVARSSYCDYPEDITSVTDIGSCANPDVDEIISVAPELLISQSPIAKKDITKIENAGTRVLILSIPTSFGELKQCYIDLAKLFGGAVNAQENAEVALSPLTDILSNIKPNGTFCYIMTSDLAVATGDTLSGDILSYFGENIAKDNQKYTITAEELMTKQPDILFFASPLTPADLPEETAGLNASAMISIDNTSFERPTVRTLAKIMTSISSVLENSTNSSETSAETTKEMIDQEETTTQ